MSDFWRLQQCALLGALIVESEINPERFHVLKELAKKYGIPLNRLDYDAILRRSWPRYLIEQPSIARKEEYRLKRSEIIDARRSVFEAFGGSTFNVNVDRHEIETDTFIESRITLPSGWTFSALSPNNELTGGYDEIADLLSQADAYRERVIVLDRNDEGLRSVLDSLDQLSNNISFSNSASLSLKEEVLPHLNAGTTLLKTARSISLGAVKFVLLDRLAEAYKQASEEVLKDAIKIVFLGLALYFLGILG